MESTKVRAKAGGEQGINGEWYEGGQFLPSSKYTVKGEHKFDNKKQAQPKTHKIEIEPYKWVEANENDTSIMQRYGNFIIFDWNKGTAKPTYNKKAYAHYGIEISKIETICEQFNNGERILKGYYK